MKSKLFILLATFNGDAYLSDQLDSLKSQTLTDWSLLISDDGSTDKTIEILNYYSRIDTRIQVLKNHAGNHCSALENFAFLFEEARIQGADYVYCCDQDDFWEPTKLTDVLTKLKHAEGRRCKPSLVHHDLTVVNGTMEPINASFIKMMNIQPGNEINPQRLISRNEVTGCAMACNKALLEIALPIPKDAIMHDWWLALFAGFFGRLQFMRQSLVRYRQHDNNVIGAKSFWHGLNPFTNWVKGWKRGNAEFLDTVKQAKAFQKAIAGRDIPEDANDVLNLYIGLPSATRVQRIKSLRTCNLWRSHWFLNGMLVLRMLLLPRSHP